jgi:protoporphyrinogen oxidase
MAQKLVVLGAGPMGLAAAYQAAKQGFEVDVLEAGDRVGGMAAHFDFEGLSIERFYHFCCLSDYDTLEILEELGMPHAMKWVTTRMGQFYKGRLYPWGDPVSLLMFPKLGPIAKLRYGLMAFTSVRRKDWSKLDRLNAEQWLTGWLGQKTYNQLWQPLLHFKFYEMAQYVSAAWIWQRINRLGRSRKSLFEERLGYIEGGSETLMNALAGSIRAKGGRIHCSTPVRKLIVENGKVSGVETEDRHFDAHSVISTIPLPHVPALLPDQYEDLKARYARIRNIAVVCVMFKLKRSVSPNFWVNIVDERFRVPGIIEFSNLRPVDGTIVYVPFYMPQTNARFSEPDERFVDEAWACIRAINPELNDADRLAVRTSRLKYAQPVYEPGFPDILPPVQTPISGLQIADTSFYYPEDRGVSESFRLAKQMVGKLSRA